MTGLSNQRLASAAAVACVLALLACNAGLEAFELNAAQLSLILFAGVPIMIWCAAEHPLAALARAPVGRKCHGN